MRYAFSIHIGGHRRLLDAKEGVRVGPHSVRPKLCLIEALRRGRLRHAFADGIWGAAPKTRTSALEFPKEGGDQIKGGSLGALLEARG